MQNKFVKIISYKFSSSHNSLIPFNYPSSRHLRTELNIQSLSSRRLQNDLIFLRKLMIVVKFSIISILKGLNITVDLSNPFFLPISNTNYAKNTGLNRVMLEANSSQLDFFSYSVGGYQKILLTLRLNV